MIGFLGNGGDTSAIMNVYEYVLKNNLDYKFDFITHKGADVDFIKKLEKSGTRVFVLDGDVRKMGLIKYYFAIKKILEQNKYDAIHFHTSFQSFVGLIAAKRSGVEIRICHSHTSEMQRKMNPLLKAIIVPLSKHLIQKYSTKRVACSEVAANNLFLNKDYDIIFNGINIERIKRIDNDRVKKIKEKYNIKENDICIGQVGRLSEMKNPFFTLNIANKLDKKYKFFFLGEGELLEDCKTYIRQKKINNVFFTGKVNNANDFMSFFDFLVLPSKYGEGLPVVITECQIVNPNCICIANDNVSKEANLGNVIYHNIKNINLWIDELKNDHTLNEINSDLFDLNNTAVKWLEIYN